MEKDIMDIVKEKEFIALSLEEKAELSEICSNEDEFNNLKQVFLDVEMTAIVSTVSPRKETKQQLDELFVSVYPKVGGVWYGSVLALIAPKEKPWHRQPLVQLAAVGLLIFLVVPFLNNTSIDTKRNTLVASEESTNEITTEEATDENNKIVLELESKNESVEKRNNSLDNKANKSAVAVISESKVSSTVVAIVKENKDAMVNGHSDGVFEDAEVTISYSIPTSEQPELFDLLTTTF